MSRHRRTRVIHGRAYSLIRHRRHGWVRAYWLGRNHFHYTDLEDREL